ncbi:MAG: AAA family ATPase [Actinomycetia bacterium]|nr:AAA family ATPase [Actinomycetes bacterium]
MGRALLTTIRVHNVGVVRQAHLDLDPGLNVLTGESGAGKSLILGAIAAGLGARVTAEQVGPHGDRAAVHLAFAVDPNHPVWAALAGFGVEPDDTLVLTREWRRDGRSQLRVQGQPVPVGTVRPALAELADVVGQHASLALEQGREARAWLDALLADPEPVRVVAARWAERAAAAAARAEWARAAGAGDEAQAARAELEELRRLRLEPDEEERLAALQVRLAHGRQLLEAYQAVLGELEGGEVPGLVDRLAEVRRRLGEAARADAGAREAEALAADAEALLAELRHRAFRLAEAVDLDPERLAAVEERLDVLARAKRRWRTDLAGLLARMRELEDAVRRYDEAAFELSRAERAYEAAERAYREAAAALTRARTERARSAADAVTALLRQLDMPAAVFEVRVEPDEPGPEGVDRVSFWFTANRGQEVRPLARVASGGELARVALATWAVHSERRLLVIDEIDAGLGGQAARTVAGLLASLAARRQILAVSHQPVVAAAATAHFRVAKTEHAGGTAAAADRLDGPARVEEIARMLSGSDRRTALAHARALLAGAG